ncbi:MAG: sugar phosphate isomerase [Planctomycetaceae bacterium]|nr:sugar phosphate isomerase [Planctomycetaceae bacterium]|tara:strand:- start:27 stop:845 length:819 start_codon:yes stop_codon:yes gene_type:complete
MVKSAVTVSLVEAARGGPFILWDGLEAGCKTAKELGFDAIEVFSLGPEQIDSDQLEKLLNDHELSLAAVGTGAGKVKHGLTLTSPCSEERDKGKEFIKRIIEMGGRFGAGAILGSMQGFWTEEVSKDEALKYLAEACAELGEYAKQFNVPFIYEHLNRFETNLCNRVEESVDLLNSLGENHNVVILADLFHMNIEEVDICEAFRTGGDLIGHIHFVDSNRRPVGGGHIDMDSVSAAIKSIGYDRYLSAEALPYPSEHEAAKQTIESYNRYFG